MQRSLFLRIGLIGSLFGAALTGLQAQNQPSAVSPGVGAVAPAAQRLTLQQCIDIALKNSIAIRQGQVQVSNSEVQFQQSKLNRLPNLNGFATQNFSSGFNINPVTNQFVERSILSNNFQLTSSVTVFNGGVLQNTIRQNELLVQSNQANLEANRNNVILTVVQNYLNVLTGQEQLAVAQRQADVSRSQFERTQKLVSAGAAAESALFDLRAQRATDELAIVNAQNTIDLAKVALLQAMNLFGNQQINVESVAIPDPATDSYAYEATPQQIYDIADGSQPDVRAADLRVRSDEKGIAVARGSLLPLLTFNGGITSLFSNYAPRAVADGTTAQQPLVVSINGIQQTIFLEQANTSLVNMPDSFFQQVKNNQNRTLGLTLQVPIFNRSLSRNRIVLASLNKQNSELIAENTRLNLRQTIETAYANLVASGNRYRATLAQVQAFDAAFRAAESRFNSGSINAVDYNIAKTNLDRARASLVQAKYDYVFKTKILDFYQNKPLTF